MGLVVGASVCAVRPIRGLVRDPRSASPNPQPFQPLARAPDASRLTGAAHRLCQRTRRQRGPRYLFRQPLAVSTFLRSNRPHNFISALTTGSGPRTALSCTRMNTIQYFLSTLRPAPPQSARASTSGLRIGSDLAPTTSSSLHSAADPHDYPPVDVQMREFDEAGASVAAAERDATASDQIGADVTAVDDDSHSEQNPSSRPQRPRTPEHRGGKAPDRDGPAEPTSVALEDPSRDGASIRTEVERDEGIEVGNDAALRQHSAQHTVEQVPASPSSANDSAAGTVASPPSSANTCQDRSTQLSSSSWPCLSRLTRWWPLRVTASIFALLLKFLGLFPLPFLTRPGYNALFAPSHPPQKRLPSSSLLLRSPSEVATDEEQGMRNAKVVSLELTRSTPAKAPPPAVLQRERAHSLSPRSIASSPATNSIPRAPAAPPRLTPKTLVLDLDETLIHSTSRAVGLGGASGKRGAPKGLKTRVVEVVLDGRSTVYTVYKRPWVDFFLRKVSSWYTVVIFTASLPEYADPVIDWLDGGDGRGGMVGARLFRADCVARNGSYMKDLSVVEPDLSRVCLVDNSPASYAINQANGIPIEGWINDPTDECLLDLLPMLDSLRFTNDVRRVLGLRGFSKSSGGDSLAIPPRARARAR